MRLTVPNMREGMYVIGDYVLSEGHRVAPRGQATREVLGAQIVVEDPYDSLPIGIGRNLNKRIAALEALQLIGGVSHPELMVAATANFANFKDGGTFHGAYGPRLRPQLEKVVDRLKRDPASRQALVTVWDPLHDLMVDGVKDYPCTIMLHFLVRDRKLVLHTVMRSNDVWWGLTYDAFQFTQLQITVAGALGLEPGRYYHTASSLHVYERDIDSVRELRPADGPRPAPIRGVGYGTLGFDSRARRARMILEGRRPSKPTPSERWYIEQVAACA